LIEKVTEVLVGPKLPVQEGRQKSSINLSNIGKVTKTAEEVPVNRVQERAPDRPLDEAVHKKAWEDFIELRKAITPDLSMMRRPYSIEGNMIVVSLTAMEEMFFQPLKTPLIAFLRDRTGNSSLLIQISTIQEAVGERKLFSTKDKFDSLAEKNPVLKDLKERFGLDPDLA
jgi:hypothetical protein